ncbi:DUF58 domain-containing protein [Mesorhizobium sp. 1B3]|uniref:DUF58 domain-containing protein n=1 Tax=Mesorhizobium sp. 1B3 TaxID=3243599 RepID=UPI003D97AEF2
MGLSFAALGRSTGIARPQLSPDAPTAGVYASVENLVALEASARDFNFARKQAVHRILAGRHASQVRGRGLAFEELREYLPGDDIRTIDWRVTARAGKPFVRVFDEEKDRPALIVVDQRMNMFFGTRQRMKSVTAAEAAALSAWRIMDLGDRVGGFVFNDSRIDELRPHRSREAVIELAGAIARQNAELRADSTAPRGSGQLDLALEKVANVAVHDHLVIVISDFEGHGARTRDLLLRLTISNDVVAILVYDPFLLELPGNANVVVSGGGLQVELPLGHGPTRSGIAEFARRRGEEFNAWQQELGLPMLLLSAAEETAPQLRRLLAQLAWRQRRR